MNADDVEATITRLMNDLEVSTNTELATALGISAAAISHWRKRGVIPEKVLRRVSAVVEAHSHKRELRDEFANLPVNMRQMSRAIALYYICNYLAPTSKVADHYLQEALFQDGIERSAYEMLLETMKHSACTVQEAYRLIVGSEATIERLTQILLPVRTARTSLD